MVNLTRVYGTYAICLLNAQPSSSIKLGKISTIMRNEAHCRPLNKEGLLKSTGTKHGGKKALLEGAGWKLGERD